jgi:hypothetical protein
MLCDTDCDSANGLMDLDTWEIIADPAFGRDPAAADTFTHLLFVLREAMSNPVRRLQARTALSQGIKTAYLYTSEHELARQLYELYLTGHLKPENEPRQLLEGAIARGKAEIKRALALEQRRKGRKAKKRHR